MSSPNDNVDCLDIPSDPRIPDLTLSCDIFSSNNMTLLTIDTTDSKLKSVTKRKVSYVKLYLLYVR